MELFNFSVVMIYRTENGKKGMFDMILVVKNNICRHRFVGWGVWNA